MNTSSKKGSIRSVLLFYNEHKPEAVRALHQARTLFRAQGIGVGLSRGSGLKVRLRSSDMAVALGGDGTVLHAARVVAPFSLPLLGVNTGAGLGFLSAVDFPGFKSNFRRICAGEFAAGLRSMLSVEVRRQSKTVFGPYISLNDCVIRSSDQARAITLRAYCAGRYVAAYFGDGLVVSTPTGSTAYALSIGGPVMDPGLAVFLLAPIAPHSLSQRPLIVPAENSISIHLAQRNPHDKTSALVSLDGQIEKLLQIGDEVVVCRYEKPLKLLLDPRSSYFERLHEKLKWGSR